MDMDSSDDVTLWNGPKERRHFEDMADLFSIIKTTQHLEKAYVRDLISADEYTAECQRLMCVIFLLFLLRLSLFLLFLLLQM